MRNTNKILVGKSEGKRSFRRRRRVWEDNNKMDLKGNRVCGCVLVSSGLGWGPVADSCERGNEPSGSMKGGKVLDYLSMLLALQEGLCSMELVSYIFIA
jgi:hypothetical protein